MTLPIINIDANIYLLVCLVVVVVVLFLSRLHPENQALFDCLIRPMNVFTSKLENSYHRLNIINIHNLRYLVLCSKNKSSQLRLKTIS